MRAVVLGSLLVIVHILEATLFQYIRIGGIAPNVIISIIVSFALLRGSKEGLLLGIGAGLLYDLSFGINIGFSVIVYSIIGAGCGYFNKNFYRENFIIPFICVIVSVLFYNGVYVLYFVLKQSVSIIYCIKSIVIPETIYTVTVSLIIYQLSYILNERLEIREKSTRNMF